MSNLAQLTELTERLNKAELDLTFWDDNVMLWSSGSEGPERTFFNARWFQFTGRSLVEDQNFGWLENVCPEDRDRCMTIYQNAFNIRQSFRMEYRLKNQLGDFRWVVDTGTPRFSTTGKFQGFLGTCIDITEYRTSMTQQREE